MNKHKEIEQLLTFTKKAVSQFHTVSAAEEYLTEQGFSPLALRDVWTLERGGKYYMKHHDSTLFAFTVGEAFQKEDSFRIGAAHGDFPGFRIKPHADMKTDGYLKLNVEPYGGVNLSSWMDRPLSLAGRVAIKGKDPFHPEVRLVDFEKPVVTIPNVAVHLDRDLCSKGTELNKQTQMLPIAGLLSSYEELDGNIFVSLVAEKLNVKESDILDYELNVYNAEEGETIGFRDEFLSGPRLDNVTGVYALVKAITEGRRKEGVNLIAVFDHEEIGSRSKQGAASTVLPIILEKIYDAFGYSSIDYKSAIADGLMMSVDVSHGLHPNYEGKYDPTNHNILNHGFSIKQACSQGYATDSEAVAVVESICQAYEIPYQKFVNRSDGTAGGTLGSIASALLPVRTVDIGVPLLAMHSAREMMGWKDQCSINAYLTHFFGK